MNAIVNTLTPSEAAVISGVSVRDVHRVIDEHILPEDLYSAEQARSFKSQACVFISFYFRAASRLTSEERQKMIALAASCRKTATGTKTIQDDFLTVDLSSFRRDVDVRLTRLRAAQDCVVSDPEILSGALVVRGTRVPVYHVAASVAAGISMERILAAYPSLNREQVELAALYAEANPQRGRPPQRPSLPPGAKAHFQTNGDHHQIRMTKLLIDECLSGELALMAREHGHPEATHVTWIGKAGWKDWELKEILLNQDWVLVTWNCKDFRGPKEAPGTKACWPEFPFMLYERRSKNRPRSAA